MFFFNRKFPESADKNRFAFLGRLLDQFEKGVDDLCCLTSAENVCGKKIFDDSGFSGGHIITFYQVLVGEEYPSLFREKGQAPANHFK